MRWPIPASTTRSRSPAWPRSLGGTRPLQRNISRALAGGIFQPIACREGDVQALTADAARQHGEAIAAVVTALADQKIDAKEARAALVETDQAIAAMCGLRGRLLETIGRE